ncbi:DUF2783 domain-containing protein [Hydrogenophaga pseudoflava]|uniref:DUF2783 domain-containing protein n=1 Tax=Hydrogenophaga pseudoflava TaxID=47421 RepID=UPI0027E42E3D|nr:DUF2783 domain-containing protein [Hydrogenophaga pseudoflava]MDQ7746455.1 DUF2783 domain-containing protein [Hydrogenophaga pseudoflava]
MNSQNPGSHALTVPGLEQVYDQLATAIDAVGPQKTELFLVKLALMNANALADPALFQVHIDAALKDL